MRLLLSISILCSFFTLSANAQPLSIKREVVEVVDSLYTLGLIQTPLSKQLKFGLDTTQENQWVGSPHYKAALVAASEFWKGYKMSPWVGFDAVSAQFSLQDQQFLENSLATLSNGKELRDFFQQLEDKDLAYLSIKSAYLYHRSLSAGSAGGKHRDTASRLLHTLNTLRWIHHFQFDQFIVVNLAASELTYVEKGAPALQMKTIVGKFSTPSPRFAAWCEQVILYPYWYVPSSIAIGEYLSKIKRNPSWLDQRNMQVVDGRGRVVDHHQLNWSSFHAGYFPYTIRQSTGCDNALGVIKFDITTPYGVYLHDTNSKAAFLYNSRYLSHGCIRLEEPLLLGSKLLKDNLDTAYLQSCYKDQKPVYRKLSTPIAVFSVYLPVSYRETGMLEYHKDPYRLLSLKKK
jgi:hypothetical protein